MGETTRIPDEDLPRIRKLKLSLAKRGDLESYSQTRKQPEIPKWAAHTIEEGLVRDNYTTRNNDKINDMSSAELRTALHTLKLELLKGFFDRSAEDKDRPISAYDVSMYQTALLRLGQKIIIDGVYKDSRRDTSETERLIGAFQREQGINPDGLPGHVTAGKLAKALDALIQAERKKQGVSKPPPATQSVPIPVVPAAPVIIRPAPAAGPVPTRASSAVGPAASEAPASPKPVPTPVTKSSGSAVVESSRTSPMPNPLRVQEKSGRITDGSAMKSTASEVSPPAKPTSASEPVAPVPAASVAKGGDGDNKATKNDVMQAVIDVVVSAENSKAAKGNTNLPVQTPSQGASAPISAQPKPTAGAASSIDQHMTPDQINEAIRDGEPVGKKIVRYMEGWLRGFYDGVTKKSDK